jgi:hypothetical protein
MKKIAIFVEGQTELIFVREYLLKAYNYQDISIECYNLFTEDKLHDTEYPFQVPDATLFFQLINVGNDNAVLSRILQREQHLWNADFYRIIGLRDMYSKQYRELTTIQGQIDKQLNNEIKEITALTITQKAKQAQNISFCFAIMETESWILGFHDCFEKINPRLTTSYIKEKLGFDLAVLDPEASFFTLPKLLWIFMD